MLLTRCPSCDTTFRISEDALRKAAGQVRCGRCSNIFNAHAELRESDEAPQPRPAPEAPATLTPKTVPWPEIVETAKAEPKPDAVTAAPSAPEDEPPDIELPPELQAGAEPAPETAAGPAPAPADVVVLGSADLWTLATAAAPPRSRYWTAAVAVAGLVLLVQVAHSFSDVLATRATLGPLVQRVYSSLGLAIVPRWDLDRYEVLNATAATTPEASGRGNLVVTARIRNRGTLSQPYPHVQLRLLDRWERTVGRRAFAPADYSTASVSSGAMLDPGASITAELVVVDPGPDAAGFEIDVCIAATTGLRCAADEVFE